MSRYDLIFEGYTQTVYKIPNSTISELGTEMFGMLHKISKIHVEWYIVLNLNVLINHNAECNFNEIPQNLMLNPYMWIILFN